MGFSCDGAACPLALGCCEVDPVDNVVRDKVGDVVSEAVDEMLRESVGDDVVVPSASVGGNVSDPVSRSRKKT